MGFNGIGIIEGPKISFIDHLVPLCDLLQIPLFCDHPDVAIASEIYYPNLSLKNQIEQESSFFYVEPTRLSTGRFFINQKVIENARGFCAFHGNSSKNKEAFWIERFADEENVLFYGDFFLNFMKEKNVLPRIKNLIRTGNFRLNYYKQNKAFFDQIAKPFLFADHKKKTILYAPTWQYSDKRSAYYSNFFEVYKTLFDQLPNSFQLIVKLHPFTFRLYPNEVESIKKQYQEKENILFLDEIPLVYPILEKVDLYLGDFSSISYDFLAFNRPLFFLTWQEQQFGRFIEPKEIDRLYQICDEKDRYQEARIKHYEKAFGEEVSLESLKKQILELL